MILDGKKFFIKKDSTFPILKYPLTQQIREEYDITDEMLESVAVTFSMINKETGIYQIANVEGSLVVNKEREQYPDEIIYTLTYQFKLSQTKNLGNFNGEFVIDFLNVENGCGKIKLPIDGQINIIISDSITKTTVI